jgi:hypothetical protein
VLGIDSYRSGLRFSGGDMSNNTGGPAFPENWEGSYGQQNESGMTLRDYFAGQAVGLMWVAMQQGYWTPGENPNKEIAEASYQIADAMIEERGSYDPR